MYQAINILETTLPMDHHTVHKGATASTMYRRKEMRGGGGVVVVEPPPLHRIIQGSYFFWQRERERKAVECGSIACHVWEKGREEAGIQDLDSYVRVSVSRCACSSFLRESKKSGSQFGLRDILTDTMAPGYGKDRPFNKPYTLFQTRPRERITQNPRNCLGNEDCTLGIPCGGSREPGAIVSVYKRFHSHSHGQYRKSQQDLIEP